MAHVYIALGANLADPLSTLKQAVQTLQQHPELHHFKVSSFYRSKPMGPQDQPDYVNAVAEFHTALAPLTLLDELQAIEQQYGRQRLRHWGPRTLDLDLLLYDHQQIQEPRLTVPHPGIAERDFVVVPLAELAPQLQLPDGRSISTLLTTMIDHDLIKIT
ncbi:2-amino-4-hydroxy-6-hydroxymethyldihydropteridinediphosphokinase [Pseudidiomarina indica]|uniref:2-amino-4-hydroxy-6-hydroxymethyldihydropteridine pyrophosphokinase n=1 Tax=Pseudidiomarina indica TaxID=1159017 RepID=A0A1G6DFY2_9GAMM|nr:2-amino-4-hydroxy-6-hydroxymethyldihydropteridine diphosphokinase [Pseudidiomarina indica]SDB44040.1 2-amino-4-hydroxy-6-hydroxymethyldihydropteridinediphosphokinase [Pseudidiomarina indica]